MKTAIKIVSNLNVALGTKQETFTGVGGVEIFTRSWHPASRPHGVVVISHGFNSHSGQYEQTAERFVPAGLTVYALDHRGRASQAASASTSSLSTTT
jgi:alpha-beta hydrolase superfamily lysophospholipase